MKITFATLEEEIQFFFIHKNIYSQTLLRHGANPDLRDEDGKTPLDKARERGHSEVVAILQSPGECNNTCYSRNADKC